MENMSKLVFNAMKEVSQGNLNRRLQINIPFTRERFEKRIKAILDGKGIEKDAVWLPDYQKIIDWLADNHGMGLLLIGPCGVGKSIIAQHLIKPLIEAQYNRVINFYTAMSMPVNIKEMLYFRNLIIDDIGLEPVSYMDYGTPIPLMPAVADQAERESKLLILTTNLTPEELLQHYGLRTYERIRSCCKTIVVNAESLR